MARTALHAGEVNDRVFRMANLLCGAQGLCKLGLANRHPVCTNAHFRPHAFVSRSGIRQILPYNDAS
jgi:hypothetical protein